MKRKIKTLAMALLSCLCPTLMCGSNHIVNNDAAQNGPGKTVKIQYISRASRSDVDPSTQKNRTVTVKCGDVIEISADVHGSVGITFDVECDTTFFKVDYDTKYHNPNAMSSGMTGGDRATETVKLKTTKKGTRKVKCTEGWRGSVSNQIEYTVIVR